MHRPLFHFSILYRKNEPQSFCRKSLKVIRLSIKIIQVKSNRAILISDKYKVSLI